MSCVNIVKEWEILKSGEGSRQRLGEFGERVATVLLEQVLEHATTADEGTRGRAQGIDLVTLSPKDTINIVEAKATRVEVKTKPSLAPGQMTVEWLTDKQRGGKPSRAAEMGLDLVHADDVREEYVERMVVQVNIPQDGLGAVHDTTSVCAAADMRCCQAVRVSAGVW
jgi:hypothetical protein